jgi:Ca2+-binding EF-hand superfamily protein
MRRLGEVTRKHRLLLKPFFQDKDIAKIGRVSYTRMRSILDNNKIPLSDYQFNLLIKNFSYENIEFNYLDFIESLKQYEGADE